MVYDRECKVIAMLSDLVEGGQVRIITALVVGVGAHWYLFPHPGGVLPVLAQQWHTEIW